MHRVARSEPLVYHVWILSGFTVVLIGVVWGLFGVVRGVCFVLLGEGYTFLFRRCRTLGYVKQIHTAGPLLVAHTCFFFIGG